MSLALGLLILRLVVGLLLAAHGAQKLFGWWSGPGMAGFGGWMGSIGLRPARLWAIIGVLGEFGGGLLLALGLLTPIGALGGIGAMVMAIGLGHWSKGLWASNGGYEFPLTLLAGAVAIALIGPGQYSLDALLGITVPATLLWAGLVGLVVVVAYGLLLSKQQATRQQQAA